MHKILIVFIFASSAAYSADSERFNVLNLWLDQLESEGFAGVVAIAKGGDIIAEEARGLAIEEGYVPNTINTYFDAASIAKTLTGASVLLAEAEGMLSTEDSIAEFLGPMDTEKGRATLHNLATHKAGLVPRGYDLRYGTDRNEYIQSVISAPQESTPGSEYRYTNAGYSLLAAILEIASGEQWQEFIDSRLLSGSLNNIYFYTERDGIKDSLAYGYALRQGQDSVSEGRETFEWGTIGAAGVYARAKDLVYLVDELLRQSPVPEQQREKMLDSTEEESYGWHVDTDSMGRNRIHKGGDSLEYTSQILYYPDSDITITWMVNNNRNRWRTILRDGLVAWVYDERIPEH